MQLIFVIFTKKIQSVQLKYWIAAFRLRTLPLALSTVLTGSIVAANIGRFSWLILGLTLLTTLFLQILSNLSNDYGDAASGADKQRVGEKRMVSAGHISPKTMKQMMLAFAFLSLLSGVSLLLVAFPSFFTGPGLLFFLVGLLAIAAAVNYTVGKNPYGYKGWGDFFVFLFFGLAGVYGTYYLHASSHSLKALVAAIAIGCLSTAVLNVNNLRDENTDRHAGKRTLVVIWGRRFGQIYHLVLLMIAWFSLILFVALSFQHFLNWLFVVALPLFYFHTYRIFTEKEPGNLDPELKRLSLSTFFTVLLLGAGFLINWVC